MKINLWAIQPGTDDKATLVERAARVCYNSNMAGTKEAQTKFLASLFKRGHLSPAEHARWTWLQNADPYHNYWRVRYGTNITERKAGNGFISFVCSMNARSVTEYGGVNPIIEPERFRGCMLQYDDLSDSEKLAHASATFEISGVSRTCSHQLVRHRVHSFSQRSQRYCFEDEWQSVIPPSCLHFPSPEIIEHGGEKHCRRIAREFEDQMLGARNSYQTLRELGIPKEDARFVLPNAMPTKLVMAGTFENWLHFIELRTHKSAQWEIRSVATEIQKQLSEVESGIFEPSLGEHNGIS